MGDIEEECENVVFEVCDAREQYPKLCTKELGRCIKLTNEINTMKVFTTSTKILDVPSLTDEQSAMLQNFSGTTKLLKIQEDKLQVMIDKIDNLKAVLDQIKRDKLCEINKLLWD